MRYLHVNEFCFAISLRRLLSQLVAAIQLHLLCAACLPSVSKAVSYSTHRSRACVVAIRVHSVPLISEGKRLYREDN